jgi:hypothetical protein
VNRAEYAARRRELRRQATAPDRPAHPFRQPLYAAQDASARSVAALRLQALTGDVPVQPTSRQRRIAVCAALMAERRQERARLASRPLEQLAAIAALRDGTRRSLDATLNLMEQAGILSGGAR